jgi:hypothetical protein
MIIERARHRPLESIRACNEHLEPALWGPVACFPPATTAASMRSRRAPGMPLMSKTVSGMRHQF